MFLWIVKQIILSISIICLIHYLYIFFQQNLTVPKIKDLVNRPERKYKEIYQSLEKKIPEFPSPKTKMDMKAELQNYLQELGKKELRTSPIGGLPKNNNYQTL